MNGFVVIARQTRNPEMGHRAVSAQFMLQLYRETVSSKRLNPFGCFAAAAGAWDIYIYV